MLGFLPKKSQSTQTLIDAETSGFSSSCNWANKAEKSTESGDTSDHHPRPKLVKKSFVGSPIRRQFLEKDSSHLKSPRKSRSPTYKYRFIPSLPLK